jgi:hypothetical protein
MDGSADVVTGGKRSAWMSHVKKTMRAHKGMKLGAVLKMASKTFKKARRGGAAVTPASVTEGAPGPMGPAGPAGTTGGRRSRRGRRSTRRSRKH